MRQVFTVGLPFLLGVMLLLYGTARLAARMPSFGKDDIKLLDRAIRTFWGSAGLVASVFVVMSALLYVVTHVTNWSLPVQSDVSLMVSVVLLMSIVLRMFVLLFRGRVARILAGSYGLLALVGWLLWPNWLTVDLLVVTAVMGTLGCLVQVTLNFKGVMLALGGLFLYDIVHVYLTRWMHILARGALGSGAALPERLAPVMLLMPDSLSLEASPASALGLGDMLSVGLLIMIVAVLAERQRRPALLFWALGGYAVGLSIVGLIYVIAQVIQPALMTLYPCTVLAILIGAKRAGLLDELFALRRVAE